MNTDFPIPAPSLHSPNPIPNDILLHIASFLDSSTAASFARVARSFVTPAETAIWRDLNFRIMPYRVNSVLDRLLTDDLILGTKEENRKIAEEEVTKTARSRVKGILKAGNDDKWKKVRSLTISPRGETEHQLAAVVENISPTVETIRLLRHVFDTSRSRINTGDAEGRGDALDVFILHLDRDLRLCGDRLFFPSLHTVYLDLGSIISLPSVIVLCAASPNLHTLTFALGGDPGTISDYRDSEYWHWPYPIGEYTTSLQDLSFYIYIPYHNIDRINTLIQSSPRIRRLGVKFEAEIDDEEDCLDTRHLTKLAELSSLNWRNERSLRRQEDGNSDVDGSGIGFRSLKYLSVRYSGSATPSIYNPLTSYPMPMLQKIYFDCDAAGPENFLPLPEIPGILPLEAELAEWLHACPHLREMYFFHGEHMLGTMLRSPDIDFDESPELTPGTVRSFRRGKDEFYHLRLLVREVDVSDPRYPDITYPRRIIDSEGDPAWRVQTSTMALRLESVWQDWTYFQGEAIELEVIDEMRRVEGISDDKLWDRRGIEVGEEAWNVLLAARARITVKREAETLFGDDLYRHFSEDLNHETT